MASPPPPLTCPACGAPAGARPATPSLRTEFRACPRCGHAIAIPPTGADPPRYAWEVYPGLYPPQPALRAPRVRWNRLIVPILLVVAVACAGLVVVTGWEAYRSVTPARYTIGGTVEDGAGHGIPGAQVVLTDESGTVETTTDLGGAFAIPDVPTGGYNLTVQANGYRAVSVLGYVSPGYAAGGTQLSIVLTPGAGSTIETEALYPDLASLAAAVGACAVAFALCAGVAATAAWKVRRADRPALAFAGAASALGALGAMFVTEAGFAFPLLLLVGLLLGALGGLGVSLSGIELLQIGDRDLPP
ncbi:MAG: carboxypeptidase-like regulatory domain-containing protein [Thermoplasmata archaeon]